MQTYLGQLVGQRVLIITDLEAMNAIVGTIDDVLPDVVLLRDLDRNIQQPLDALDPLAISMQHIVTARLVPQITTPKEN